MLEDYRPKYFLDGDVSTERFEQLVGQKPGIPAAQVESDPIDFKSTIDMKKLEELAKDIAAFANSGGGYLLIGVEQQKPKPKVTGIDSDTAGLLSEPTILAQKVSSYLTPSPLLRCNRIPIPSESQSSVIIFVEKFESIPVLFLRDGRDCHAHALYTRRQAASQPATKDDWQRIIEEIVERQQNYWTRQVDSVMELARELAEKKSERPIMEAFPPEIPDTPLNRLKAQNYDAFYNAKELIDRMIAADLNADTTSLQTEFSAIVETLTQKAIDQIRFDRLEGVEEVISTFEKILNLLSVIEKEHDKTEIFISEKVLPRITALGAVCIRHNNWHALQRIVRGSISGETEKFGDYWHRCLMTRLYRTQNIKTNPLAMTSEYLKEIRSWKNEEERLFALCQFDYLRCLLSIKDFPDSQPLTHFALYDRIKIEPIVGLLINSKGIRISLDILSERALADLCWKLEQMAKESLKHWHVPSFFSHEQWNNSAIRSFFDKYPQIITY
jgi:hypothetical protein